MTVQLVETSENLRAVQREKLRPWTDRGLILEQYAALEEIPKGMSNVLRGKNGS